MSYLVDRRVDGKGKSTANRQRFLRRYRKQIKQSVNDSMGGRSIEDTTSGGSVSIPREDMHEPQFSLGPGGLHQRVFAGNKKFGKGDMIRRPPSADGQGGSGEGEASDAGLGEDEFVFQLTRDEFLEVIFDQLELPNLIKQQLTGHQKFKYHHGGVVSDGNPSRINIVRSFRSAHARRIASSGARAQRLQALQQELEDEAADSARRAELLQQIEDLTRTRRAPPFIDDLDIRYNLKIAKPEPTCQAVMVCVMDVSGSMDERTKDIAKRFYMLLYMFLQQQYKKTEVVFVRHHTEAKEVDEQDFFYARETGGTVVSSALKLTHQIITDRYPADSWNIYVAQASDGDNWGDDCAHCLRCLQEQLLPLLQQFFYVEIAQGGPRTLWNTYELLLNSWGDRFSKRQISDYGDIYPVFRQFFEKRGRRMNLVRERIATSNDWTFELIQHYDQVIGELAAEFGLDTYKNQIEIIHSEQMMDAYASAGMPVGYHHWSYGKNFLGVQESYQRGQMGLAYEIVINSDPCISYLMEENSATMQALVIAHACYGHNSFFKGNYLFRDWIDAGSIIDYMLFARNYISDCEQRYGEQAVERTLDSCHALMNYGVDRYKRPPKLSAQRELERQRERQAYRDSQLNELWDTVAPSQQPRDRNTPFPSEPQENILYFIEKNAPLLQPWQREIVRIVRKTAQYFYPQRQTQVMNEGWASYWHYTLLNTLYDRGHVDEGFILEFLQSHSNVLFQPSYDHPAYSGFNPYALGFAMYKDIERVCEQPNEEDKRWFPDWAGGNAREMLDEAMRNYKDESFIQQFLSPKVMRDFKMFSLADDDKREGIEVMDIHNKQGYTTIRDVLATSYNLGAREADIQVVAVDLNGDRSLTLHHQRRNRIPLDGQCAEVMKHIHRLWGFDVHLKEFEGDSCVGSRHCPELKAAGI